MYYKVASSQLPAPQSAPRTTVVLQSRQFSASKSHSRLHFAHPTRTISAEGCPGPGQIALSPAFRASDTRDLRRGLTATKPNRTRLHFAHPARTISRRGLPRTGTNRTLACISRVRHARSPQRVNPGPGQIARSPAFRASDTRRTRDLRRRLHARDKTKSHSRLHFARPTRTISAEGCPRQNQIALSPAFRASDTHGLRRGLRFVAVRRHCPRP